jgi:type IV secretory pathway TraG/TraD family ATPase VirD4
VGVATFAKMNFQRAVLKRIPVMARCPDRHWRPVLLAADECHAIVTCGEDNPIGDERFLSQSRQAKLIPILATQSLSSLRSVLPGESWRTLVQTLRTKVFLALSDDFSAKFASDLCGKSEQLRPQYSMSESGQDARVSVLTGLSTAHRSSVTASRGYHVHRDLVFEPKTFAELGNAQAIVLAYTGSDPLPPTRCYLKPWYLDPNVSYFEQVERGELE